MVTLQAKHNSEKKSLELQRKEGDTEKLAKPIPYREAIGSLAYLDNGSRPDILYAVNQLSRRQSKPTVQDYEYVKRVFHYLRRTESYGLMYRGKNELFELFSDASHRDCIATARSTTGFVIMVYGDLVNWASKRQSSVSKATCESENKAMNETARALNY